MEASFRVFVPAERTAEYIDYGCAHYGDWARFLPRDCLPDTRIMILSSGAVLLWRNVAVIVVSVTGIRWRQVQGYCSAISMKGDRNVEVGAGAAEWN